jgi:hypothetical protein
LSARILADPSRTVRSVDARVDAVTARRPPALVTVAVSVQTVNSVPGLTSSSASPNSHIVRRSAMSWPYRTIVPDASVAHEPSGRRIRVFGMCAVTSVVRSAFRRSIAIAKGNRATQTRIPMKCVYCRRKFISPENAGRLLSSPAS